MKKQYVFKEIRADVLNWMCDAEELTAVTPRECTEMLREIVKDFGIPESTDDDAHPLEYWGKCYADTAHELAAELTEEAEQN